MINFLSNFAALFQESAPWLLLGLLVAGIVNLLVPIDLLKKHMGERSLFSIVKAAIIGAPLPLCSCGVIPAALGLRRAGASKPTTTSFLVATPETGVDSISISYALLGPFMAIIRPISAISSAIYVGLLTLFMTRNEDPKARSDSKKELKSECCVHSNLAPEPLEKTSCCASKQVEVKKTSCCSDDKEKITQVNQKSSFKTAVEKTLAILRFASGKLLNDIARWLLIGLVLAAVIKTWVPTDFLTQWGSGFTAMLVMALIGIPMYICATASTPIAAGFLAAGVSPGAVLVFMLAGPATNLSTMGMIRQEMGHSTLVAYLTGILSSSIFFGYVTNWAVEHWGFEIYRVAAVEHSMTEAWIYPVSAILLAILILKNEIKRLGFLKH